MSIRCFQLSWAITLLVLSSPFSSRAQHSAALKVHTFRALDRLFTIGYEQAFHNKLSVDFSLQGGYYIDLRPNRMEEYEVRGIGAIGALRYYPFTKRVVAPRGFFAYAAGRYIHFDEAFLNLTSGERYKVGGNIVSVGLGIGYKFVYRRFGLEAFVGWGAGQLGSRNDRYRNDNIPAYYRAAIEEQEHFPQLDVALCYMFSPFSRD